LYCSLISHVKSASSFLSGHSPATAKKSAIQGDRAKSTPKEEGGGDKTLSATHLALNDFIIANDFVHCKNFLCVAHEFIYIEINSYRVAITSI